MSESATFQVRPAVLRDIDELSALLNILFTQEKEFEPNPERQRAGLEQILRDPASGVILVGISDGRISGMVNVLYTVSTALGKRVAILEDLIVEPQARRTGLGSLLLNAAVSFCRKEGCARITLLTDHDNSAAHRLYERAGFTRSSMVVFRRSLSK